MLLAGPFCPTSYIKYKGNRFWRNISRNLLNDMKTKSSEQYNRIAILQGKITLTSLKIQEYIQSAVTNPYYY